MIKYRLMLDVKRLKTYQLPLEVKQGDQGSRFVHAILINDGVPINLENTIVTFFARKKDETIVFNRTKIENGEVIFELTSQVLAVEGMVDCELVVYSQEGYKLTSATFKLNVIEKINDDEAVESTNEYTQLTETMIELVELVGDVTTKEDIREENENIRQENEIERKYNEEERKDKEVERKSNELERESNEADRLSAESTRESQEDTRESNESERENAESIRNDNEDTRQDNESSRISAETDRVESEADRDRKYTEIEQDYEERAEHLEETYAPRLASLEGDLGSLIEGGEMYQAVLRNGWTHTSNLELKYVKNDLGFVMLFGRINAGTINNSTVITRLPAGYRPPSHTAVQTYDLARGKGYIGLHLATSGELMISQYADADIREDARLSINITFKV